MSDRFKTAHMIWNGGASNRRAVARELVKAIDEALDETGSAQDPAVQMIIDHLCFLVGLPQPSMDMDVSSWDNIMKAVEERA